MHCSKHVIYFFYVKQIHRIFVSVKTSLINLFFLTDLLLLSLFTVYFDTVIFTNIFAIKDVNRSIVLNIKCSIISRSSFCKYLYCYRMLYELSYYELCKTDFTRHSRKEHRYTCTITRIFCQNGFSNIEPVT